MKTWTQLQELVELHGDQYAQISFTLFQNDSAFIPAVNASVRRFIEKHEIEPEQKTVALIGAAIAWKTADLIVQHYKRSGEGWCEVYYRDLKRMFEEES